MQKFNVLNQIQDTGIVAVVRAENSEEAISISQACIDGGINAIEITFTVPGADKVIADLLAKFGDDLLVGAGTVLDSETARIAILAGAKYIVGPNFNKDVAKLCNRYRVPYMPGCMTINEIVEAMEYGVDIVKAFPGNTLGPGFVKSVKGPIPQVSIMPTGGVSLENVDEWIKAGCIAVGVGGQLTKGDSAQITNTAKEFVQKIKDARK